MGIKIGLEPVNRYESNLINTASEALEYIELTECNNLCVHLDSYHMNIEESSYRESIIKCGRKLGYFHVGENHRGAQKDIILDRNARIDGNVILDFDAAANRDLGPDHDILSKNTGMSNLGVCENVAKMPNLAFIPDRNTLVDERRRMDKSVGHSDILWGGS